MTTNVLLILIVVVVVAWVVFNYMHKRNVHFNPETLKKNIVAEFEKKGAKEMDKETLVLALKRVYGCSHKVAVMLLGKANERKVVSIDHDKVTLC